MLSHQSSRNLKDVKEQAIIALSVAKQWQHEQRTRDAETEAKLVEQATAIENVLADRNQLIGELHKMHRDFLILRGRMEQQQKQQRQQQQQHTQLPKYDAYYSAT